MLHHTNIGSKTQSSKTMTDIALYEEYVKMVSLRKKYYCKLILGDNFNKRSIFNEAIN